MDLLEKIDKERSKFFDRDTTKFTKLIDECINKGIYPAYSTVGYSALEMVEAWGAYWHIWKGVLNCPHCNTDLRDHSAGPPFKLEIGIIHNDRLQNYECPECEKSF